MDYQPAVQRYNTMEYRRCGKSGLKLPAISLGLWHNFGGAYSYENGRAMVRRAAGWPVFRYRARGTMVGEASGSK